MTLVDQHARAAKDAARVLAVATRATKDQALHAMADALMDATGDVLDANAADVSRARESGTSDALIDRLALNESRVTQMANGLRQLAGLADPVGEVVRGWNLANGPRVEQVRVPMGVIGMIYEARPNVTADAAGICLKAGSASLLRGSSSAVESNRVIVAALCRGLVAAGLPETCVTLIEGGHEATDEMMKARGLIDLLIPRGGAGLINAIVQGSQVPVIETGTGNCHLYLDAAADLEMALPIIVNAKTQRPSVCNALETIVVHREIADTFVPRVVDVLGDHGVTVHGDESACGLDDRIVAAEPHEFEAEYLSLDVAMTIVDDIDQAIAHIQRYSTGHSETIVTNDAAAQTKFVAEVDAATVLVNASSRFVDGGEFGFGAEIGISTQKMHARGPMALPEMTSTKYIVRGQGQTRA